MSATVWIILGGAVMTYLTRIGGHLVLSRMSRVPPRLEAALNAVPAAVLTTLVAPAAFSAGPAEIAALVTAGLIAFRGGGMMALFLAGSVVLIVMRQIVG